MIAGHNSSRGTRRCARLAMIAGLASGLGTISTAHALSFVKLSTNFEAWNSVAVPARDAEGNILWDPATDDLDGDGFRDENETPVVFRAITGQGVTIGMIEAAHPMIRTTNSTSLPMTNSVEHHIAFNGLDHRRIWYPYETRFVTAPSAVRSLIEPRTTGGSLKFPTDFHRHATAVAAVMVGRNASLFGEIETFGPITGIAPNAQLLSGALATDSLPDSTVLGVSQGISPEAFLFTLAAMTDLDFTGDGVGDYITPLADWYGVEPWEPASVINISFGQIASTASRGGESVFSRLCDIVVQKTNTVIVSSVGDEGMNGFLENIDPLQGFVSAPASAHNTIAVGRTGSGADIDTVEEDSGRGPIVRFNWIHMDLDGNLYLQDPNTMEDYSDINFLDGMDPRDPPDQTQLLFPEETGNNPTGTRTGVDIVAPGTLVSLPADPTNPSGMLSTSDVWGGWSGTSFSAALVTGAVALMQEYGDAWEFSTDPLVLRAVLMNSAMKPDDWDHNATPDQMFDFSFTTTEALDERYGAGVLDFERILVQYRATAGGYADLDESNQNFLLNSIRPLFRRNPNIGADPATNPDAIVGPNSGTPGTVSFMPVVGALRSTSRYFETFVNGLGQDERREYFFTDPGEDPNGVPYTMVTFFADPTNSIGNITAPPTTLDRTDSSRTTSITDLNESDGTGWTNHAAQPVNDRFGFNGIDTNRTGNTGSGNRTGSQGTGNTVGGSRPGAGGETRPPTQPQTSSGLKPCESVNESRCVRAGWDIGRLGVGSIDLPIGSIPDGTDVTATLVWNRTEDIADSVYENLLNGVITATLPSPILTPETPETQRLATTNTNAEIIDPEIQAEIDAGLRVGPSTKGIIEREVTTWKDGAPNQTLYPLVMAGETLRGPAPTFVDLDIDRDGVLDMLGDLSAVDNCLLDPTINLSPVGVPFSAELDSYNPEQIDMDGDNCGPPCDSNDALPPLNPEEEPLCSVGATSTFGDDDSERLRRVNNDFYTTPNDELNINSTALSGVVGIRINRNGSFSFGTGVVISPTRVLTAAHIFDTNNDGVLDSGTTQILFPSFNRFTGPQVYAGTFGGVIDSIDLNPSFNFIGQRGVDMDPENVTVENGRDDLAIITVRGSTFPEFIDAFTGTGIMPYTGAELQIYDILTDMPPSTMDGQEIIFAGYGESGDGRFGVAIDPTVPEEDLPVGYVPVGLNPSGQPLPLMRVGKNVIDFYPNLIDDDDPGNPSAPIEQFGFDFDERTAPDSLGNRIESMITFGDSGSPSFFHDDTNMDGFVDPGELQLFGLNTAMAVSPTDNRLSAFGSNGLGMVLSAYVGTDAEGNDRFIDAILNELPPVPQGLVEFDTSRASHFDLTTEFKFDNLDLQLIEVPLEGIDLEIMPTYTSSSSNNVEHIFAQDVAEGNYILRITWAGPVFDWSGFVQGGNTPFRKVRPLTSNPPSVNDLSYDDLTDFFPSEVKYGLAWWVDIPFDRIFEASGAGARTAASVRGDLNGDAMIDSADLARLISHWGTSNPEGDLTLDGTVDINDLVKMVRNYGQKPSL